MNKITKSKSLVKKANAKKTTLSIKNKLRRLQPKIQYCKKEIEALESAYEQKEGKEKRVLKMVLGDLKIKYQQFEKETQALESEKALNPTELLDELRKKWIDLKSAIDAAYLKFPKSVEKNIEL